MTYTVRLDPGGASFEVDDDETILVAAERQGQRLKYGCRHGRCSSCKYQLLDGDVEQPDASIYSLSDAEREEGWALVCCAYPVEDLVLLDEAEPDRRARPVILPTAHEVTVLAAAPVGGELWQLVVSRPDLEFHPGQFFELRSLADPTVWRPYSAASAPDDERLSFLIKRLEGGAFSSRLDPGLVGSELGLRGPFGDAYLRDGTGEVVLVATGSGIAPACSMLRHAARVGDARTWHLFHGVRDGAAAAVTERLRAEVGDGVEIRATVCVSPERVTQAVQRHVGDASAIDAYLCGHPDMCAQVTLLLEAKGVGERNLFADPFWSSAPLPD